VDRRVEGVRLSPAGHAPGVASSVRLSKAMSHALRHDPAAYGLTLDAGGWTPVAALVEGLRFWVPNCCVLCP
jgi:RNA:NAD 2'-phosphotransferase (TPT1/KptA family)